MNRKGESRRGGIAGGAALAALLLAGIGWPGPAAAAEPAVQAVPLQPILDQAEPGSELVLAAGDYAGPAVVDKTLTIRAESGATLYGLDGAAALTVRAPRSELRGIRVVGADSDKLAAVAVEADDVVIRDSVIESSGFGISLRGADRAVISGNVVHSAEAAAVRGATARTGNGIDLYESHEARIEHNEVFDMKDGIYLEKSHRAIVEENRIYRSRYGIHCMYTDGTIVRRNEGEYNVTGAMVMGVRDAVVTDNSFRKQSENVHSQGLLLFDVQTSLIERNTFEGNRVGIYMELSSNNRLANNEVLRNFVGIQFLESSDNSFASNVFLSNVIEAQATDSAGNRMENNYWDAAQSLDADGDGIGDLAYAINPFFERAVDRAPAFQLFFQSPGMTFLSGLFTSDKSEWSEDIAPLMEPPEGAGAGGASRLAADRDPEVGWIGFVLTLAAVSTIYLGVRKS
ncbi:right-handed parallel beta-helix repeat-containing protein [Cohnella cellulosilytica]|uniref:Nitrous oxide reductase family maturation protein NosD n=1 Tax=Cohnella cellulosilytica TaxID=986710 RepID=A0ABW2FBL0_9BACL